MLETPITQSFSLQEKETASLGPNGDDETQTNINSETSVNGMKFFKWKESGAEFFCYKHRRCGPYAL